MLGSGRIRDHLLLQVIVSYLLLDYRFIALTLWLLLNAIITNHLLVKFSLPQMWLQKSIWYHFLADKIMPFAPQSLNYNFKLKAFQLLSILIFGKALMPRDFVNNSLVFFLSICFSILSVCLFY